MGLDGLFLKSDIKDVANTGESNHLKKGVLVKIEIVSLKVGIPALHRLSDHKAGRQLAGSDGGGVFYNLRVSRHSSKTYIVTN